MLEVPPCAVLQTDLEYCEYFERPRQIETSCVRCSGLEESATLGF